MGIFLHVYLLHVYDYAYTIFNKVSVQSFYLHFHGVVCIFSAGFLLLIYSGTNLLMDMWFVNIFSDSMDSTSLIRIFQSELRICVVLILTKSSLPINFAECDSNVKSILEQCAQPYALKIFSQKLSRYFSITSAISNAYWESWKDARQMVALGAQTAIMPSATAEINRMTKMEVLYNQVNAVSRKSCGFRFITVYFISLKVKCIKMITQPRYHL